MRLSIAAAALVLASGASVAPFAASAQTGATSGATTTTTPTTGAGTGMGTTTGTSTGMGTGTTGATTGRAGMTTPTSPTVPMPSSAATPGTAATGAGTSARMGTSNSTTTGATNGTTGTTTSGTPGSQTPAATVNSNSSSNSPSPSAVQTRNTTHRTNAAPVPGRNSFTQGEATRRISAAGYTKVMGLKKDSHGIWRGQAEKDGNQVGVALDYQGNVSSN